MLLQINYELFNWLYWLCFSPIVILIVIMIYAKFVYKGAKEFEDAPKKINIDDCQHEHVTFKVGILTYSTEEGARTRCEALYKRHNINAEVTLIFSNEEPIKCYALDIWDFNK